jgi:anti-sigma factor RsiW
MSGTGPIVQIGMSLERFQAIVAAYGAEPDAWPEAERVQARRFCERHPEAARVLAEAREIDTFLAQAPPAIASDALKAKILASAPQPRGAARLGRWLPAGAIAASLIVGVLAAWPLLETQRGPDLSDEAAWEALGDALEFTPNG